MEGRGLLSAGQPHARECACAAPLDLVCRKAQVGGPVRHVLEHGLGKELTLGMLHHVTDAAMELASAPAVGGVDALHHKASRIRGLQGAEQPQQRGLARPRLSDDGGKRSARDAEADGVEGWVACLSSVGVTIGVGELRRRDGALARARGGDRPRGPGSARAIARRCLAAADALASLAWVLAPARHRRAIRLARVLGVGPRRGRVRERCQKLVLVKADPVLLPVHRRADPDVAWIPMPFRRRGKHGAARCTQDQKRREGADYSS